MGTKSTLVGAWLIALTIGGSAETLFFKGGFTALTDHTGSVRAARFRSPADLLQPANSTFSEFKFSTPATEAADISEEGNKKISDAIAKMPLAFRKNMGQWDNQILFEAQSVSWNAHVNFLKDKISFGFSREKKVAKSFSNSKNADNGFEVLVWNLNFVGANPNVMVEARGEGDSHANYFLGNDETKFAKDVPDYRFLSYQNIYPGIAANYYCTGKELKYDYVLNPGADVKQLKLKCEGVKKLSVTQEGQLAIETQWGTLIETIPESYQLINGRKVPVTVEYKLIDSECFGYTINGTYDHSKPLVIDPVNLNWATFVGGAANGDVAYLSDIALDPAGNIYATGQCYGWYPVTAGSYDTSYNGGVGYGDVFVCKLSPNASTLLYSTFVGGTNNERGFSVGANASGEAYVCGTVYSNNFPTTGGAFQSVFGGARDAFVLKLNAGGNALVYSTYLGGGGQDEGLGMVLDNAGNAYITGYSTSNSFTSSLYPTTAGVFDANTNSSDAFITEMNPTGTALVFSTFTGGNNAMVSGTIGRDIKRSANGDLYVCGYTFGIEASPGAYQTTYGGGGIYENGFVVKLNSTGTSRGYATYLGKATNTEVNAIAINAAGEVFATGYSADFGGGNTDYPTTAGAYNTTAVPAIGFLTKLNSTGTGLIYSTYLNPLDAGYDIAVSSNDEVFIAGETGNTSAPAAASCGIQKTLSDGAPDFFVSKFNSTGTTLLYYTYLGGSGSDYANGIEKGFGDIALVLTGTCEDQLYVAGSTHSLNTSTGTLLMPILTTAGTYQPTRASTGDMPYVFKLKPSVTPNFSFTTNCNVATFKDLSNGNCVWQTTAWTPGSWTWNFGDGSTATSQNPTHTFTSPGTYQVKLVVSCPKDSIIIPVTVTAGVVLTATSTVASCGSSNGTATTTVTTGTNPYTYTWSNGSGTTTSTTSNTATGLVSGTYTVTVTGSNGCSATTTATVGSGGSLTLSVTSSNPTCSGTSNGSVTATATSGTGNFTYNWSTGASTITNSPSHTLNGLGGNVYTVTITDGSGCSSTSTASLIAPTAIVPTSGSSASLCSPGNGSVFVNATGGGGTFNYTWSNGASSQTATAAGGSTYTVTVTDGGGCTVTSTTSVSAPTAIVPVPSSSAATCGNNNGSVSVNVTGGAGSYSYSWSTAATSQTVSGLAANSYTVTITDANGCTITTSALVSNSGAGTAFALTQTNVNCNGGGNGSAAAAITGGTPNYTYSWSNGASSVTNSLSNSLSGLVAGNYTVTITDASGCKSVSSTSVTEPTVVSGNILSVSPDCGTSNGSATVNPSGGGGTYTYSWSSGPSAQTINGIGSGTYTVTISDQKNCTGTTSVILNNKNGPGVTVSGLTNPTCNGINNGNATASVSGGSASYTYSWSTGVSTVTGAVTNTVSGLGVASYTVTITDAGGCTSTSSVTITSPAALATSAGTVSSTCGAANGKASVSVTGGTGNYTYNWSAAGATAQTITAISAGSYTVTVIDAFGCTASAIANVLNSGGATASLAAPLALKCNGDNNGSLSATASGGNASYTYSWSNGASSNTSSTTNTISGLPAGLYTVTITDGTGCASTSNSSITQPVAIAPLATSTAADCSQSNGSVNVSVSGGAGNFSYAWSTSATTQTVNNLPANTYTVTITDGNNCSKTATTTISNKGGATASASVLMDVSCNGASNGAATSSAVGGTASYTYSWSNGSTGATISNLPKGTYSVTVTDGKGCTSSALTAITEPAKLTLTPFKTDATCTNNNGSFSVSISGGSTGYAYSWTTGTTGTTAGSLATESNLAPGAYTVTVTDSKGCTSTTSTTVNQINAAVINITPAQQTILEGTSVSLLVSGASTYTWSPATGLSCSNCANPTASPTATTNYTITATDANGCVVTAMIIITVKTGCVGDDSDVFIANVFSPNGDGKNDVLTIDGSGLSNIYWAIYDRWGNRLFETFDQSHPWDGAKNGNAMEAGTYVYYLKATCIRTNTEVKLKGNVTLVK